eukprot:1715252-Pleurochrysis_carterae.AAC.1
MSTCGFHCYTPPTAPATSCTSKNIFPPLSKFLPEISELVREHGLSMTTNGRRPRVPDTADFGL